MFGAQVFGKSITAAAIKPPYNGAILINLACERWRFAGQIGENALGNFLGEAPQNESV